MNLHWKTFLLSIYAKWIKFWLIQTKFWNPNKQPKEKKGKRLISHYTII